VQLVPPPAREAAVAPAGAAATDVLLEHDDSEAGVALGQEIGRPQAGEAAADDDDVSLDVLAQGRAGHRLFQAKGFPEPPAPLGSRSQG